MTRITGPRHGEHTVTPQEAAWITGQVIYADGGASLLNAEVPPEIQFG